MMKILHLEASSGWGGQEIRILREALGMRERGHEVLFAVMPGAQLGIKAKEKGFIVYETSFRRSRWLVAFFRLCKIIASHEIDVVNTHSSLDSWIGGIASRWMGRKIVRTRHLSTPIKQGFNSRILYGKLADFVVTTCASIVETISKQSGKPLDLCRSVPTGVEGSSIRVNPGQGEEFRKKLGISHSDFLVGTACFMRSWKGIDDFLKAADLLRDVPGLRWVIIGGGHIATYQAMAQELKLEGLVFFTGHLENPFPAIDALDVFSLLSTAHEGVSQAILQAAYLGKPLIATAIGGLGEVCLHQKTGLQVAPHSPKEVAAAVLEYKNEPSLRENFGRQAKLWVEKNFSWENTLNEMEKIFLAIVGKSALH